MAASAPTSPGPNDSERFTLDLSGQWEFKIDPLDVGRSEKWFNRTNLFDQTIRVPGCWNAEGVGFKTPEGLARYEKECLLENKFLINLGVLGQEHESEKLFHVFPGPAWYRRSATIPANWKDRIPWLVFGGIHREGEVWINGRDAGVHRSYPTPFRINLSDYVKAGEAFDITVRVDARRQKDADPLIGCFDTLDFLSVSWGGIWRDVTLEATPKTRIDDVFIIPKVRDHAAEIRCEFANVISTNISVQCEILDSNGNRVASDNQPLTSNALTSVLSLQIPEAKLWSPRSPYLYTAKVRLFSGLKGTVIDSRSVRFGMREFSVSGNTFMLNGQPFFLRGCGDDCIFPNSICPPMDVKALRLRLKTMRDYGFNYIRTHSWVPPPEYLNAADEMGMMVQPEFPFAYHWDLPQTPEAKRSAMEQWKAIIRLDRNHPCVAAWCMGNEQYDSFDIAPQMYAEAKQLDSSRPVIDSDGCTFNGGERRTLDFLSVAFDEGQLIGFRDHKYDIPDSIKKPVIGHEMGYFVTLPDIYLVNRFHSGLRPYWLYQAGDLLHQKHLENVYPQWLEASRRLQAVALKSNLEAARMSRLAGTSVWLFQDYPNCPEGVVNMFYQPKRLGPEQFRNFNAPTVLLLDSKRNWWWGDKVELPILVSRYEDGPSDSAVLRWKLREGTKTIAAGTDKSCRIPTGGVQKLATVSLSLPIRHEAKQLTFEISLTDTNGTAANSWNLWVFPKNLLKESNGIQFHGLETVRANYRWSGVDNSPLSSFDDVKLLVTADLDKNALNYLTQGGRVLLLNPAPVFKVENCNFRPCSWDGGGTLGTIFDARRDPLSAMPSQGWCDLQFYYLIQGAKSVLLDNLPGQIEPLVRCIDRPTRFANRAYLFEATVGKGKLLVSGFDFDQAIKMGDPAGIFFMDCLLRYADGPEFAPSAAIPMEALIGKDAPR